MRLLALGTGDAFSARYYSTCLALEQDGAWLLIDCPHPIRKMMAEASASAGVSLDVSDLVGAIVTHLHADHASGFEGLGYFAFFVLGKKLPLLCHPQVAERLWDGHLAAGMEQLLPAVGQPFREMGLEDYFAPRSLDEERAVQLGPFSIECRRTIHHIPTTALRITAGGRTLGHSADTAFDPSLIEWLSSADLVLHETNYGVHTPFADLTGLPAPLRAKMRILHYPDQLDLEEAARSIRPLRQAELIEV